MPSPSLAVRTAFSGAAARSLRSVIRRHGAASVTEGRRCPSSSPAVALHAAASISPFATLSHSSTASSAAASSSFSPLLSRLSSTSSVSTWTTTTLGCKPASAAASLLLNTTRGSSSRRSFASSSSSSNDDDDSGSHSDFAPQRKSIGNDEDEALTLIEEHVQSNRIMLYMKGNPSMPMCGFSAKVVSILQNEGVDFASVNVLDYPTIREGVKKYSDWPTIPQLYVGGEFVGGCDIVSGLHESGELKDLLATAGGSGGGDDGDNNEKKE